MRFIIITEIGRIVNRKISSKKFKENPSAVRDSPKRVWG
jgi:hypothetical protein